MTRPETPYEAASYELNKFRERRLAERRAISRDSTDRRAPYVKNKDASPQVGQIFEKSKNQEDE